MVNMKAPLQLLMRKPAERHRTGIVFWIESFLVGCLRAFHVVPGTIDGGLALGAGGSVSL